MLIHSLNDWFRSKYIIYNTEKLEVKKILKRAIIHVMNIYIIYSFIVDSTKEKKQPAENIFIIPNIIKIKESVLFAQYKNYKKYFFKRLRFYLFTLVKI